MRIEEDAGVGCVVGTKVQDQQQSITRRGHNEPRNLPRKRKTARNLRPISANSQLDTDRVELGMAEDLALVKCKVFMTKKVISGSETGGDRDVPLEAVGDQIV